MPDVEAEARWLAEKHYEIEEGIRDIIRLRPVAAADGARPSTIALLEINENTAPVGIMPLGFAPAPSSGIHFPSVIIEVTPEEFEQIKAAKLSLPDGWRLGDSFRGRPLPAVYEHSP